jgi:16S rRNA (guanine1207-N2)-methyltransferase
MNDHYYSQQPASLSNPSSFHVSLRGHALLFYTDHGVFSRREIDAGSRLLIASLPTMSAGKMLDLGCGYGAVGIAMAVSTPALNVWMSDINARAVELAMRNSVANKVHDRVQVLQSDGFDAIPSDVTFDMITLNPPIRAGKSVVYRLYENAKEHLRNGGLFYVVIQKKQGAASSESYLREIGFEVKIIAKEKGYRVYECKK